MSREAFKSARTYSPNLEVADERRIAFWLNLPSWTVVEAAMLFCDIDPHHATVDDRNELTDCSTMEGQSFNDRTPHVDAADPEVDPSDVGPWNIDFLADEFRNMRQTLQSAVDAGGGLADKMAPTKWIEYAEERRIPIPWLEFARRQLPHFAWPKIVENQVDVGIDRDEVMRVFRVRTSDSENTKFWNGKLADVPAWLEGAIVTRGKRGVSHRWDPLALAHAILKRPGRLMTLDQLDRAVRRSRPALFEQWLMETEAHPLRRRET